MGFSHIGIWEILVILVVILLVLGPNRLPEVAKNIGQAIRTITKVGSDITTGLTKDWDASDDKHSSMPQPEEPCLTEDERKLPFADRDPPRDNEPGR